MTAAQPTTPTGYPPIFQYSQDSLQDYGECARRFQLRHLIRQAWPAPLAEPLTEAERDVQMGEQFHRMADRHWLGLAVAPPPGELGVWWKAFLDFPLPDLPGEFRRSEAIYSIPFGTRRLVAKFDLVAIAPGQRIVIVDWKTSHRRPDRSVLAQRWQTRVYQYVATEALAHEFGGMVPPEAVSLVYWFAAAPNNPETLAYSAAQHAETRRILESTIAEIEAQSEPIWPLTDDLRRCQACQYRSLCERDVPIAAPSELDLSDRLVAHDALDWTAFSAEGEGEL